MKELKRTQLGNPILRKPAKQLSPEQIESDEIKQLIENMRYSLVGKKLGIGLAAPQVDKSLALAVIAIRPTPIRPKVKTYDLVLINPVITATKGRKKQLWEGCISAGSRGRADLFAQVPRYPEIKLRYLDEHGKKHHRTFKDLRAHVIQHEVDHLNGILFVDKVKDSSTFMTYKEYKKAFKEKRL